MEKIPLTRPYFDNAELSMIDKCLRSGWVTQGPMVSEFERRFASLNNVKYAIATSSCTAALHLAALSLNLCSGDEAIVPAYTWVTSANCIEYTGARAVFADVDINTYNIDPKSLEAAITEKTKAVVVVHLFGLAADMDSISAIARKYGLKVIEDAACAVGCSYNAVPVGSLGEVGCFSFHPRKVITTGEGGMVTTNDETIAQYIGSLRNHGTVGAEPGPGTMPHPYDMSPVENLGYNLRMSDIQGAVGLAQLEKLDRLLMDRRQWAAYYNEALREVEEVVTPPMVGKSGHTYQAYVIRLRSGTREARNQCMDYLFSKGIWTRPGTHAVHRLGYYKRKYGLSPGMFPNACAAEDMTITLPLYYGINEEQIRTVVELLKEAISPSKGSKGSGR